MLQGKEVLESLCIVPLRITLHLHACKVFPRNFIYFVYMFLFNVEEDLWLSIRSAKQYKNNIHMSRPMLTSPMGLSVKTKTVYFMFQYCVYVTCLI